MKVCHHMEALITPSSQISVACRRDISQRNRPLAASILITPPQHIRRLLARHFRYELPVDKLFYFFLVTLYPGDSFPFYPPDICTKAAI